MIERLFDQREPTPRDSQVAKRLLAEEFTDLVWEHSHIVSAEENGAVRAFCIYSGPSEARVREHSSLLAPHTIVNIFEIAADVTPEMIPPEGEPVPDRYQPTAG